MAVSLENAGLVPAEQEYFDVGLHSRKIRTTKPDAQVWFDRGLTWAFSFNHREAAACFQQVIAHDPQCVLGYWGAAFALGPNYNKKWAAFDHQDLESSVKTCHEYAREAVRLASVPDADPAEKALADAIQKRFPSPTIPGDFTPSVHAYADTMRLVHDQFGQDDLDIVALAADALMNIKPWNLYNAQTGEPNLETPVLEVKQILDTALKHPKAEKHPGVLHMYIHLTEMSSTPERAVIVADYLRDLVPDGGHMHHMPSHIDVLVGDWRRALNTNLKATIADDKYVAKEGGGNFYSFYRMHNYHSLIYAAMMAGRCDVALEATGRMEATISEDLLLTKSPPMADWLEFFLSVRVHVLIRFGKWEELKELAVPENKDLYCVTVAMTHYGKAIAWAATGDVDKAEVQKRVFYEAAGRVPPTRLDFPNRVVDELEVAKAMLEGEIEYRRGNFKEAFESLRLAIHRDDHLLYSEPWGWMLPTRHPYAALLLEQGRVQEAADVYAEDLGFSKNIARAHQHPNNLWALIGYHECLVRLGRADEANMLSGALSTAAAGADIPVKFSCFCRLGKTSQNV